MPQDISVHGHLIDEQYSDNDGPKPVFRFLGLSVAPCFLHLEVFQPKPGDKIKTFPVA